MEVLCNLFCNSSGCRFFVVSFDFRWVISIFDANFIISAGIDHGSNAIHYTGLMDGLRSAAVAVGHAFS